MNHIALVLPQIEQQGGAEIQVMQLACELRRRGWRVTVIALSGSGGSAAQQLADAGTGLAFLRMHKGLADPAGWLRLHSWIRAEHPDILHAHLPHAAWMARWSRLFAPVRVVIDTIHTSSCGTLGRRLGYRCSNWLADAVTAVSRSAAGACVNAHMVSRDRLVVIPNGVDTQKWKSTPSARDAARAALGFRNEFLWLTAGRLEPVKNFSALLDAFARLDPDARLVIAGAGSMKARLLSQATLLGVANRVAFPGFTRDLPMWMQAADAFVLPSLWEGLPMVLLEAAACSLPAVATDVPGSRDAVRHCQTGLLAPAGSAAELAAAMNALMRLDPAARLAMGRNARRHVETNFEMEAIVDRWADHYQCLLQQRTTAARRGRMFTNASTTRRSIPPHPHHDPPQCHPRVDAFHDTELPGPKVCDDVVE